MKALRDLSWWLTWTLGGVLGFVVPFALFFILVGGVASLLVADVDAVMDSPAVFPFALAGAFAAGGAGLGLVQWLHVRRRMPRSAMWVAGSAAGFAVVGLVFAALSALTGGATETVLWARLLDEVGHNAMGGALAGYVQWRFVLSRAGVRRDAWLLASAFAFVCAGFASWLVSLAARIEPGDAAPAGILALGVALGLAYRRLTSGPGEPEEAPAPEVAVA